MPNDTKCAGPGPPDAAALETQTNSTACAKRLDLLMERSFGDLQFLLDEFSRLEVALAPESKEEADSKLVKLRFFISHVHRTMARMRDARSGRDPLSMPQLALLEEHIAKSIAPVKERLVSQMSRDGGGSLAALTLNTRAAATDTRGRSGSTSSGGTQHEVGVTDGEEGGHSSTSRSSSVSSSMGGGFGGGDESLSSQDGGAGEAGVGGMVGGGQGREEEEDEWSVGMELNSDVFGTGGSVSLGVVSPPPPRKSNPAASRVHDCCSSSSNPGSRATPAGIGSSFSRLCWSGGLCGNSSGSGGGSGGLDLIGGSSRMPLEHNRTRRDHLDMLSQLEAEGVFAADDSYSPCGRDPGMLGGVAFSPFMVVPGGAGKSSSPSRAASGGGCGGQERDDLSPVSLREVKRERDGGEGEEEGGGGGGSAPLKATPAVVVLPAPKSVKQELSEKPAAVASGVGEAISPSSPKAVEPTPVGSRAAAVPPETVAAVAPGVVGEVTPPGVKDGASPTAATAAAASNPGCSGAATPFIRPKCEPTATPTIAAANPCSRPAAGEARETTPVTAPGTGASCAGSAATWSAAAGGDTAMAAAPESVAPSSSKPLPSAAGGSRGGGGGMLLVPPRPAKRRRSSSLPAALLQPREVRYQCGLCSQSYAATVAGNPWWLLVRQECPACHKMQIPRVDILNPTNNVERHIAFLTESCPENGSDGDGSFMDWDGDTSEDNSGDEYSGDERDGQGSSAGAGSGDGGSGGGGGGGARSGGLGASLDSEQAAKLLVLMCHARDCPGHHRDPRLAEVCQSVKFLMLHLRDCDGRTRAGEPCPFPWCQPCTSLLHHLIQCPESAECQVCNPHHLPSPLRDLRTLNHTSRASSPVNPAPSPPPQEQQQQQQYQQQQQQKPRPPVAPPVAPPQLPRQQQYQPPHDGGHGGTPSASPPLTSGCASSSSSSPPVAAAASAALVKEELIAAPSPARAPASVRATHEQ